MGEANSEMSTNPEVSAGPPLREPVEKKDGQSPRVAERIGEGHLVPLLAPPSARAASPSRASELQQTRTSYSKPLRNLPRHLSWPNRTTSQKRPLITLLGDGQHKRSDFVPFRAEMRVKCRIFWHRSPSLAQISRNASAGRKRAACSAGQTVASKQAATAKQPVSRNSVGRN